MNITPQNQVKVRPLPGRKFGTWYGVTIGETFIPSSQVGANLVKALLLENAALHAEAHRLRSAGPVTRDEALALKATAAQQEAEARLELKRLENESLRKIISGLNARIERDRASKNFEHAKLAPLGKDAA